MVKRRKFWIIHDVRSFVLHVPMGLLIVGTTYGHWILGACVCYMNIKYQEHEQERLSDWPDIDLQGTIGGVIAGGIVWGILRAVL